MISFSGFMFIQDKSNCNVEKNYIFVLFKKNQIIVNRCFMDASSAQWKACALTDQFEVNCNIAEANDFRLINPLSKNNSGLI